MGSLRFQPKNAADKDQYIQMLHDGIVGENPLMTREQYDYEISDHLIYQGPGFVVYKWYGCEFFISTSLDETGEYAFSLNEIESISVLVSPGGDVKVSWDADSQWPKLLDYIQRDGFPVDFQLFKDYGLK